MRLSTLSFASLLGPILATASWGIAAPAPINTVEKLLERACQESSCAEGYRVAIRKLSFEAGKQQATLQLNLSPAAGIDYPILHEKFEAQLVQNNFAAICRIRQVASPEAIIMDEVVNPDFLVSLKACLGALSERTERALGRSL